MTSTIKYIVLFSLLLSATACKRAEFLDKKPMTNILSPKTLKDFQGLLDNTAAMSTTGIAFGQLACDDYELSYSAWQNLKPVQRNSYVWASEIYQGEKGTNEWDRPYTQVFYANCVLEGLEKSQLYDTEQGKYLKGWALFSRAFVFYDLIRTYCKAYDATTASTDLGIPLRLRAGIDYVEQRSSLQKSIAQVIADLDEALALLPAARPSANLNRPSKIAVYALLARIYLDMREYEQAETNADASLALYSSLIDYNTLSKTETFPFSFTHDELIFNCSQSSAYSDITGTSADNATRISSELISLYQPNDLRLSIFFTKQADGSYKKKAGYFGISLYPFTGLAVDEVYLVKAECLARKGEMQAAMDKLNQLLIKRFPPTPAYVPLTASSPQVALATVLAERRKELVWRGLRWHDLKRLNKEEANITLIRVLNGQTYSLPPNDDRWVFPIHPDEIALSGLQQNQR